MTEITTALQTGFTAISGNVTEILSTALPVALGVLGIVIAVKFGVRWFRSIIGS